MKIKDKSIYLGQACSLVKFELYSEPFGLYFYMAIFTFSFLFFKYFALPVFNLVLVQDYSY